MPKTKISEFSSTPGNNTDIDGINIAEGCAPSGINDAIRELMSQLKDFQAGTAGDSFNGPVGTTTAAAGAFTTLSASGAVTLSGGTANGVPYLNGSKVLTTGSALTFDGANLGVGMNPSGTLGTSMKLFVNGSSGGGIESFYNNLGGFALVPPSTGAGLIFYTFTGGVGSESYSEQMRLTSTGLGIGTSSPAAKLQLGGYAGTVALRMSRASTDVLDFYQGAGVSYIDSSAAGGQLAFATVGTERMRLDAVGNLGLGVTPDTWGARVLQFANGIGFGTRTANGSALMTQNAILDGSDVWKYKATAAATAYQQLGGFHYWSVAGSGTAGNTITGFNSAAMTLDASGKLGVGVTSPQVELAVYGNSVSRIHVQNAAGGTSTTDGIQFAISGLDGYLWNFENGFLAFGTNNTERARIDSSGNLLVGTTSSYSSRVGISWDSSVQSGIILRTSSATLNGNPIVFQDSGGTARGSISQTSTSVSYNTSSDYRLKENIQPMTGALAKVAALKPCTYKWKADGSDGEGFIAHELAEVVPQCVTGEKDAVDAEGNPVYQGIDTSFLVATLTAAIQELKAEFDAYKATHP